MDNFLSLFFFQAERGSLRPSKKEGTIRRWLEEKMLFEVPYYCESMMKNAKLPLNMLNIVYIV